jgi:APA family basic amino acid/polyamine antiporter
VVISFLIAGISALLSALCYSEFSVQYPYAGGAYNYISLTLGELAAWLVVTTLVLVRRGHDWEGGERGYEGCGAGAYN